MFSAFQISLCFLIPIVRDGNVQIDGMDNACRLPDGSVIAGDNCDHGDVDGDGKDGDGDGNDGNHRNDADIDDRDDACRLCGARGGASRQASSNLLIAINFTPATLRCTLQAHCTR